ncbi:hypothetical protein ABIC63_000540 [Pseudacidovorax sp. 1753]|uniref:hypothetical protein n=1 Tax=Pseudacidovorax sp. 1753 TaxID=3156419 RepID=UPI003399E995
MTIETFLALIVGSTILLAFIAGLGVGLLFGRRRALRLPAPAAQATELEPGHVDFLDIAPTRTLNPSRALHRTPCASCETVVHCSKSGCIPVSGGPAPEVLQPGHHPL